MAQAEGAITELQLCWIFLLRNFAIFFSSTFPLGTTQHHFIKKGDSSTRTMQCQRFPWSKYRSRRALHTARSRWKCLILNQWIVCEQKNPQYILSHLHTTHLDARYWKKELTARRRTTATRTTTTTMTWNQARIFADKISTSECAPRRGQDYIHCARKAWFSNNWTLIKTHIYKYCARARDCLTKIKIIVIFVPIYQCQCLS